MKFIKSLKPELILASVFALAALIAVVAGHVAHNPYFTIAAGALVLATYITCPPYWAIELTRFVTGKQSDNNKK